MSRIFHNAFHRIGSRLILSAIFFLLVGAGLGTNTALCQDDSISKVTAAELKKLIEEKADDKVLLPILENAFRNGSRRAVQKVEARISMHLLGRNPYHSDVNYLKISEPIDGLIEAISSNLKQKKDVMASLRFAEALGIRAKPIATELLNTLSDGDMKTQHWATRAIGSMISEEDRIGEKELVQILRANTDASWAAAETLSKIQSPDAYPVLLSEIQKPDGIYLCNAILNYESKYKEYREILLSALGGEEYNPFSLRGVFDALNQSNVARPKLRERLIKLIRGDEPNQWVKTCWIGWLGDMGEFAKPALPTLEKIMIADCPASTRFAIENAIRKIDPKRAAELGH